MQIMVRTTGVSLPDIVPNPHKERDFLQARGHSGSV